MFSTSKSGGISIGPEGQHIPVRWEWLDLFDHEMCMTLFVQYREAVAELGEIPITLEDLARMFLAGCKYGRAYEQAGGVPAPASDTPIQPPDAPSEP